MKHIQALLRTHSPVSRFELAADAIATGDLAGLKRLPREDPDLVRARSTREHEAPLIHYVAANGVEDFVDQEGTLRNGATPEQLSYGFISACEYGRSKVVKLLLDRQVKLDAHYMQAQTGLHWAAYGGQVETVDLLLKTVPEVNAKDQVQGGTPLGWGVYGWSYPAPEVKNARHHDVVERLIRAGAIVDWE